MKRTAVLVLLLLAVAAHAQRSSSRSADESPRSSRGSRKFDSASVSEELGEYVTDRKPSDTPAPRASSSRRAAPAPRVQPQQQAASRRRSGPTAGRSSRSRPDLQALEPEQVAASSVIAPVVTQQFVSRRSSTDKGRASPSIASRRSDSEPAPSASEGAPTAAFTRRRPPAAAPSNDVDPLASAFVLTSSSRRRPPSRDADPVGGASDSSSPSRRRPTPVSASTAPPTAAPAPVVEPPAPPPEPSTTTTTAAPATEPPTAPERVVPPRFDSARRRGGSSNGGGVAPEAEPSAAPRQRGGSSGRRAGPSASRRGSVSFQESDQRDAASISSRDRARGSRREQQPVTTPRATATRGRGASRTSAGTSSTTTTTTTTSTTTEAPLLTNPDTEVAPQLAGAEEETNAVPQADAVAAESASAESPPVQATTEAVNPRAETTRRRPTEDGGAGRQPPTARRGSPRARGGPSATEDSRAATPRRSGSRGSARSQVPEGEPPTGAGAPASFARTGARRPSLRSRPVAVDLSTADSSQNDVQHQSSSRARSQTDSTASNSRRSSRRGTSTPDTDTSGNVAASTSLLQRTSRKINTDTSNRPTFKNTRRGDPKRKPTTISTTVKEEIDESENYPPEFIQKIKSSVDSKEEKTTQSSVLSSSPEDTFITKSSDKVVSVFTPAISEDERGGDENKENQNNEVHLNKVESRRKSSKYTSRVRPFRTGPEESIKQRKVDLLLAPSPPSESENQQAAVSASPSSQIHEKSTTSYSLRGSKQRESKKDGVTEPTYKSRDTFKAQSSLLSTPSRQQLDSPVTAPTQNTRAAFRTKSSFRSRHNTKTTQPDVENIVTAPGNSDSHSSRDSLSTSSFRRGFSSRGRSSTYKDFQTRNQESSSTTEGNIISSRSYTGRPSSGKTRTTSSFRRSVAATTDDIQNEIQTSAQPPATPRPFVGSQRFSARFRSDLLLATGGLRSTTTPAYIPTVPLIRAASTTTTETSAAGPGKWSANGGRTDTRSRSARVNLL